MDFMSPPNFIAEYTPHTSKTFNTTLNVLPNIIEG